MGISNHASDARPRKMTSSPSSFVIPSPVDQHKSRAAEESIRAASIAGAKSAAIWCVGSSITTLIAVRKIPWAKANLNYTAQALIISGATISAYFVTVDKKILQSARSNARYRSD